MDVLIDHSLEINDDQKDSNRCSHVHYLRLTEIGFLGNRHIDDRDAEERIAGRVYFAFQGHEEIDGAPRGEKDADHDGDEVFCEFVVKGIADAVAKKTIVLETNGKRLFVDDVVAARAKLRIQSGCESTHQCCFSMRLREFQIRRIAEWIIGLCFLLLDRGKESLLIHSFNII